uniref:Uncharacterized protein n=1 Tax=Glossina austeni TaxID=7395 RepID=A0A1A9VDN4_GLOAU
MSEGVMARSRDCLVSLSAREEVRLLSGASIIRDVSRRSIKNSALISDAARGYPNNPNARFNAYILRKLYNYLQTHYLRLKLLNQQPIEEGRKGDDYGGGGGGYGGNKKGGYEAMIAAAMMIKGTLLQRIHRTEDPLRPSSRFLSIGSLMAMAIGGVALIAGKALMAALMALTMAAVAGLKGMSGGGGKSTTYEIVAKPIHTSGYTQSMSYDEGHMMNNNGGSSGYGVKSIIFNIYKAAIKLFCGLLQVLKIPLTSLRVLKNFNKKIELNDYKARIDIDLHIDVVRLGNENNFEGSSKSVLNSLDKLVRRYRYQ